MATSIHMNRPEPVQAASTLSSSHIQHMTLNAALISSHHVSSMINDHACRESVPTSQQVASA